MLYATRVLVGPLHTSLTPVKEDIRFVAVSPGMFGKLLAYSLGHVPSTDVACCNLSHRMYFPGSDLQ